MTGRGCMYCGTELGAWRETPESYYDGVTMRRRCGCGLTYDMFRIAPAAIKHAPVFGKLVTWEISDANRRARVNGWSPSWGWALVA